MSTSLRHLGRGQVTIVDKTGIEFGVLHADGSSSKLLDASGGPLLQSLVGLTAPPQAAYAPVTPSTGMETPVRVEAEQEIMRRVGMPGAGLLWASSGSDTIEAAYWSVGRVRELRGAPPVRKIVVRRGCYHGNTLLGRFLTTRGKATAKRLPIAESHVLEEQAESGAERTLSAVRNAIADRTLDDSSLLILETVPTSGWHYWAGKQAYRDLLLECRRAGVSVVLDEVASGSYRHGWFAASCWLEPDAWPDAITLSKGLSCGAYPIGVCVLRKELADTLRLANDRTISFTMGLSDVAASVVLDRLRRYDTARASNDYARRTALIHSVASTLARESGTDAVESTETSIRVSAELEVARRIRQELLQEGIWLYLVESEFPLAARSMNRGFLHLCPALDCAYDLVERVVEQSAAVVRRVLQEVG